MVRLKHQQDPDAQPMKPSVKFHRRQKVRRTWRNTSQRLCEVSGIPPGFKIVLVDAAGRVKRDDWLVWSLRPFGGYPKQFSVSVMFREMHGDLLLSPEMQSQYFLELRDIHGRAVSEDATLREIREMPGRPNKKYDAMRFAEDGIVQEIAYAIEQRLEYWQEEFGIHESDIVLKGLIRHIVNEHVHPGPNKSVAKLEADIFSLFIREDSEG